MADPFTDGFTNALMMGVRQSREAQDAAAMNAFRQQSLAMDQRRLDMAQAEQNALMPLRTRQLETSIAADEQQMALARAQGERIAAEYASDAKRRAEFEAEAMRVKNGVQAYQQAMAGDPRAFEAWATGEGDENLTVESFPYYLAMSEAGLKALEGMGAAREFTAGPKMPDSVRALELRAEKAGLAPGSAEYQRFMAEGGQKPPQTTVNVTTGDGSTKFYENLDKAQGDMFGALLTEGMNLPAKMATLDELDTLLSGAPHGAAGVFKQAAGRIGIPSEGLDEIQAASAILERLVPAQRAPGSGPMSDADVRMFRDSLPKLINQPGGNQMIMQAMRGVMAYQMRQSEIADKVASREITPSEGRKALMALENPLRVARRDGATKVGGGYTVEEVQ